MNNNLLNKKCVPCEVGGEPLGEAEVNKFMSDLPKWNLSEDNKRISRKYKFNDFKESLAFVNKVGALAEEEGHHPDFRIVYNEVTLDLFTHEVGGLSENDFIMATKIDALQ